MIHQTQRHHAYRQAPARIRTVGPGGDVADLLPHSPKPSTTDGSGTRAGGGPPVAPGRGGSPATPSFAITDAPARRVMPSRRIQDEGGAAGTVRRQAKRRTRRAAFTPTPQPMSGGVRQPDSPDV